MNHNDTIAAIATGTGGAIALIRVSGSDAISVGDRLFRPADGKALRDSDGYTIHYGTVCDGDEIVDDVLISLFRAPRSYTGEDMIEISCHGSRYIQQRILDLLVGSGVRLAEPGEFTTRAFLAGKMDLSQAEAVADIISAENRAAHRIASTQMRGRYSEDLGILRSELLELAALLELELDFGEEEVEFADRTRLTALVADLRDKVERLTSSFRLGNAIKEGVAVAIVGAPNAGKSTLLNALLREDRAMVSDIPGTTRDTIEESVNIGGVKYRFIDTAGLRATDDRLERMGIDRALESVAKADVVLYVAEPQVDKRRISGEKVLDGSLTVVLPWSKLERLGLHDEQKSYIIVNKIDKLPGDCDAVFVKDTDGAQICGDSQAFDGAAFQGVLAISAKTGSGIETVVEALASGVDTGRVLAGDTIVSNGRHFEALQRLSESLLRVTDSFTAGLPSDLVAQDIRESLYYLGSITGEITTDNILEEIFSKFCIGK